MAKISKKQIKEDKFSLFITKLSIFFTTHWKKIVIIASAAIIVIVGIISAVQYTLWRNNQASLLLSEGLKLYEEAEGSTENDPKAISSKYESARLKFDESYEKGGTKSTRTQALFYSAKCLYNMGKYNDAIARFKELVDKYPKSILAPSAKLLIAESYEQLSDDVSLRKAIEVYDELSKGPESFASVKALIAKARCHEKLGEKEQAITLYKAVIDKFRAKIEEAIEDKSKTFVEKAKDVISKYEKALGKDPSDTNYNSLIERAKALEKSKELKWFDLLKLYDQAIFSKTEGWYKSGTSDESSKPVQEAIKALQEYQDQTLNFIKNVSAGKMYEAKGDWDNALKKYDSAIEFNFLPDKDMYEDALACLSLLGASNKIL